MLPPDPLDSAPDVGWSGGGIDGADVGVERSAGPVRVRWQRIAGSTGGGRGGPAGGDLGIADPGECELHGGIEGEESIGGIGDVVGNVVIGADGRMPQ